MGGKVLPVRAMRDLGKRLPPTMQITEEVNSYAPELLAKALGPDSGIPNAWTSVKWAAHACQAAWYHLYLAHHDCMYYRQYRRPPDPLTGDALAVWFFTSFTLHAVAAEDHLAVSMLLLFKKPEPTRKMFGSPYVSREIKDDDAEMAALLNRITGDHNWQWVRGFRERWFHLDPLRVEELGLQWRVSFRREFWHAAADGSRTLPPSRGDTPEVTVEEMLDKGVKAFTVFARQLGIYVRTLDEMIRREWQRWDPSRSKGRLTIPRKRPIRFLK